jgi:hypothetical protein
MECDFFKAVDWQAVLERRSCGPWIPPEEPLIASRRKKEQQHAQRQKELDAQKESEDLNFVGWEGNGQVGDSGAPTMARSVSTTSSKKKNEALSPAESVKAKQTHAEPSVMEQSELLHIRESIFAHSAIPKDARIQDWSFVDATTLGSVASAGNVTSPQAKRNANQNTPSSNSKKTLNKL